ncbi:hypothetical protein ES703_125345 [subsurface metagenome]
MAGDVFNEKDKVNVRAFTEAVVLLSMIEKPCLFVTGNHDFVSQKEGKVTFSALSIMKEMGDNFYIDEMMEVKGQKFWAVPYHKNLEEHYNVIRKGMADDVILVTHAEVKGAVDGKIQFSSGLPLSLFKKFKASVIGHIHTPQTNDSCGLVIPGSPMHHDFGDIGRDAFAWEMTIKGKAVYIDSFEVEASPRFVQVNAEDFDPSAKKDLHYYRVVGEVDEPGDNVLCIPEVEESVGIGRGEVRLLDTKEQLLDKWIKFKGVSEEDYADYFSFGGRCIE